MTHSTGSGQAGSDVRKYYNFGGQTILRDGTGLQYMLTDHLGSVVAITDATGTLTSQQRYLPFGAERTNVTTPNALSTDYGYTGQRKLDSGMGGLMDYKARFYSPYLNHFIQPDSLIPDPSNPQAWNRFSYVGDNPVGYSDPSGHKPCNEQNSCEVSNNISTPRLLGDGCGGEGQKNCGGKTRQESNICIGQAPYVSQYTCGLVITESSYPWMTNSPAPDDYTSHGYGGGQTVFINRQAVNPSVTRGSSVIDLSMIFFGNLVFNTNFIQQGFDRSAHGIIPFITDNSTGNTAVFGVGVYNNTGWDIVIGAMEINGVHQRVDISENVTTDNLVIAPINPQLTIDQNQVSINYSIYSAGSYIGLGTISYQGPIGP